MKNWKKVLGIALASVMTLSFGAATAMAAENNGEYYMITFQSGIDYWKGCYEGFEKAGQELGLTTVYTGSVDGDFSAEADVINQVVAKQPAGIAVTCVDPEALEDSINAAREAGIPVVTFDSDSPASNRLAYLGTGNVNAGAEAAAFMADYIGGEGKVGLVYFAGSQNQEERAAGFMNYMANIPGIEVVEPVNGGESESTVAAATASLIQANPDIKGIFACNAWTGLGVGTSVEEAGLTGEICVVAFDTDAGVLDYIEQGVVQGSVVQGTQQMGYWALKFLVAANDDAVIEGWEEKGLAGVPASVDTGVSIVTAENLENFR